MTLREGADGRGDLDTDHVSSQNPSVRNFAFAVPGVTFALSRDLYSRAILTFYTLDIIGYALAMVLNDVVAL